MKAINCARLFSRPLNSMSSSTSSPPIVSVAMCTYNGARYLSEQLMSIVGQTRRIDELVVVDDASSDTTWNVLRKFEETAVPLGIAVHSERNQQNLGVVRNFERALRLTRGDIVFTCDQDDVWHTGKVERMVHEFQTRPDLTLLHTNARLVDAQGLDIGTSLFDALELSTWEAERVHGGHAFDALIRRNLVTGATAALRRSLIEQAGAFPVQWVHDEWLAIIAAAVGRVDFLNEALIDYRQHGGNQIGMRKLSFKEKLDRLRRPRGDFHRTIVVRVEALLARLRALEPMCSAERIEAVEQKLRHARVRAALPTHRPARLPLVLNEALNGGYRRYSTGWKAVVRDLFEPL